MSHQTVQYSIKLSSTKDEFFHVKKLRILSPSSFCGNFIIIVARRLSVNGTTVIHRSNPNLHARFDPVASAVRRRTFSSGDVDLRRGTDRKNQCSRIRQDRATMLRPIAFCNPDLHPPGCNLASRWLPRDRLPKSHSCNKNVAFS